MLEPYRTGYRPSEDFKKRLSEEYDRDLTPKEPTTPTTVINGTAVASLVLGIVSLVAPIFILLWSLISKMGPLLIADSAPMALIVSGVFLSAPAVFLGHLSMERLNRAGKKQTGAGLTIAGLITGYIGLILAVLLGCYFAFVLPAQMKSMEQELDASTKKVQQETGESLNKLKTNIEHELGSIRPPSLPSLKSSRMPFKMPSVTVNPSQPAIQPVQEPVRRDFSSAIRENETRVIAALKEIVAAEEAALTSDGRYAGSLQSLAPLKGKITGNAFSGYRFSLMGSSNKFRVNAAPEIPGETGQRYFYVDESSVIRSNPSSKASSLDGPLGN